MSNDAKVLQRNGPVAHIDLASIVHNCRVVRDAAPNSQIMAVIKADAYGHGLGQVARTLSPHVDALAVARVTEACELRDVGIEDAIIVLQGFASRPELDQCIEGGFLPVVHSDAQVGMMLHEPEYPVWLKVDTGMHRLGLRPSQLMEVCPQLNVIGVMSHLANSDQPDHPLNAAQLEAVQSCTEGLPYPLSLANSGAVLSMPDCHLDWVRPGVMLFGSSADGRQDDRLRESMSLSAPILSVQLLDEGDRVGYGSTWTAEERCRVAVVGVGYADGYPREISHAEVQTHLGRRTVVGRVSMDMLTILLRDDDAFKVGDRVTLWGEGLSISQVAMWAGTIPYTLMTGLAGRVHREYAD